MKTTKKNRSKFKTNLLRWWYKNNPQPAGSESEKGKFKVHFNGGKVSQPMNWKAAQSYAEILNGKIIDNF